ncbi:2-keto-4-pentenoate hydratase [Luteococcus sp. Sow4_B9]|uniref:2-keto-4-pentenoate hydratase n=1 Tax=Luteococcus sp. Sow4_B9 TaxID=3438792 RepID=UPI003F990985
MTNNTDNAVERLLTASQTRVPCAPVRDLIGRDDVEAAYAVQEQITAHRLEAGAKIIGRKIGLTSVAVQKQLGVDQPDFGVLLDDMVYEQGAVIPADAFMQPKIEGEVAFVLGKDLAEGELDMAQIREAVAEVRAALEICDSRIENWDISFGDTVADNASAGAYVLGDTVLTLDEVEPREVSMTMTVTGQEDSVGTGEACLGDPLIALQWLAVKSRELGNPLKAGQVILSGALGPMRPVAPGGQVNATISKLGDVSVSFGEKAGSNE